MGAQLARSAGVHWSEEDRCAVTEINFPHEGHQEDRQTRDTLDTRQRAVTQKEGMDPESQVSRNES